MLNFPDDLVNSLKAGRVRLFVGSGVSAAAGLLGWNDLIRRMKAIIKRENRTYSPSELQRFLSTADYLDVAEVFRQTVHDHRYFSFLREQFRKDVPPCELHTLIGRLHVTTVLTTNYDKLLEATFRRKAHSDPAVIVYPEQLGYVDPSEVRIVKLHGDIDHPSSLVLTRTDYSQFQRRRQDFVKELQVSVNDHTVLFIGFGLRDSNFRRIYDDARQLYDSTKHTAYALMTAANGVERGLWEHDGLIILSVDNHDDIPKALRQLERSASRRVS
jgi:NAD-dependent SIR2 family protein deacetylase